MGGKRDGAGISRELLVNVCSVDRRSTLTRQLGRVAEAADLLPRHGLELMERGVGGGGVMRRIICSALEVTMIERCAGTQKEEHSRGSGDAPWSSTERGGREGGRERERYKWLLARFVVFA